MRRIKLLSLGAVSLLAVGVLAACGGSSGGDEDPQEVLNETFTGEKDVSSGILGAAMTASGESGGEDASFDLSFGGPFQDLGEGQLPAFDLSFDFTVEGPESASFSGAVTSTGEMGFLTFMGTAYEVDSATFDQFKQGVEEAQGEPESPEDASLQLSELGIDPTNWLTNLTNEGNEDVEGTETIHISGDANVAQIAEDFQSAAEQAGEQVAPVPTDELSQVEDAVREARIDVFTGVDDKILRRLVLTFGIDVPEGLDEEGGTLDVEFSVTLSELNEEQTIEAPSGAQPLSELLGQFGLTGGLGGLGLPLAPGGTDDSAPAPPPEEILPEEIPEIPENLPEDLPEDFPDVEIPEDAQAYLDCIAAATSPADLEDCAPLAPQ
ncbi:MAG: hypothetical protein ACR2N5_02555 [Solirubrobacterales bacterium]